MPVSVAAAPAASRRGVIASRKISQPEGGSATAFLRLRLRLPHSGNFSQLGAAEAEPAEL
jgi:hypothetical protein